MMRERKIDFVCEDCGKNATDQGECRCGGRWVVPSRANVLTLFDLPVEIASKDKLGLKPNRTGIKRGSVYD